MKSEDRRVAGPDEGARRESRAARLRRDVAAYSRQPQTRADVAMARSVVTMDLEDETDWEALHTSP